MARRPKKARREKTRAKREFSQTLPGRQLPANSAQRVCIAIKNAALARTGGAAIFRLGHTCPAHGRFLWIEVEPSAEPSLFISTGVSTAALRSNRMACLSSFNSRHRELLLSNSARGHSDGTNAV